MSKAIDSPMMPSDTSGSGPQLVLLPGGLTGWISWIPHAEALSTSRTVTRLQLLSVELGLRGESLPDDYSVNYEVAALGNSLDDLKIDVADFAAWSYGAMITLSFAIHHPERVRSLTLIEPPAYWISRSQDSYSPTQQTVDEARFLKTLVTNEVSEEQLVRFTHLSGLVPEEIDPRTIAQWPIWLEHRQSLRIADNPAKHEDSIELVRAFDKPALLVKGDGSSIEMHHIIDVLAGELPDVEVIAFPGGHAPHILSMQPFMERFTYFLLEQH